MLTKAQRRFVDYLKAEGASTRGRWVRRLRTDIRPNLRTIRTLLARGVIEQRDVPIAKSKRKHWWRPEFWVEWRTRRGVV